MHSKVSRSWLIDQHSQFLLGSTRENTYISRVAPNGLFYLFIRCSTYMIDRCRNYSIIIKCLTFSWTAFKQAHVQVFENKSHTYTYTRTGLKLKCCFLLRNLLCLYLFIILATELIISNIVK